MNCYKPSNDGKMTRRIRLLVYGIMTLLIMVLIFFLSSQNGEDSKQLSNGLLELIEKIIERLPDLTGKGAAHDIRKYAHMMEYLLLGASSCLFFREVFIKRQGGAALALAVSLFFCVFYAVTDEIHQLYVPGRAGKAADVLFDTAGASTGIILTFAFVFLKNLRKARKT